MADFTFAGSLRAGVATLVGLVQVPSAESWDTINGAWGDADAALSEDKPVYFVGNQFYQEGIGTLYNGLPIVCSLVRTGLTITGKGRKGEWTIDPTIVKEITGIYPVIRGTPGQVVQIKVGAADFPDDPVRWDGERDFIIGVDSYLDYVISGKYLAVSFASSGNEPWELLSYELEVSVIGQS